MRKVIITIECEIGDEVTSDEVAGMAVAAFVQVEDPEEIVTEKIILDVTVIPPF